MNPQNLQIPWVGWVSPDGRSHLSTWDGETRRIIIAPVPIGWGPSDGVLDGSRIYEIDQNLSHQDRLAMANRVNGVSVIVFTNCPKGEPISLCPEPSSFYP